MCLTPDPPKDNSAEIARQEEEARQAKIRTGRASIDKNFGQFNDPYFKKVGADYSGAYMPDLEDQYSHARKKLILSLARSGNLNASAGAKQMGNLDESYQKNRVLISDRALAAEKAARANVEGARSELYSQLSASADPSAAATSAAARVAALSAPPVYSPLGDLFANFLNSTSNAVAAERAGYPGLKTGLFSAPKNSSQTIVS
jgi:hypothetical protein